MRRWVALFQRRLTTARLCTQVYEVKLSRSALGAWREQAITRLLPAAAQTAALVMRNTAKRAFCSWRQLLLLRAYQMKINEKLRHSKKRRILGVWKSYIGALRRQKKVFGAMARRALQPIFQRWRSKVSCYLAFSGSAVVLLLALLIFTLLLHYAIVSAAHSAVPSVCPATTCMEMAPAEHTHSFPAPIQHIYSMGIPHKAVRGGQARGGAGEQSAHLPRRQSFSNTLPSVDGLCTPNQAHSQACGSTAALYQALLL